VTPETAAALYSRPRMQGDADALEYVKRSGDFVLATVHAFPGLPQFYLVFVRASALPGLPPAFVSTRLFAGEAHYATGNLARGLALLEEELLSLPFHPMGYVEQAERLLRMRQPQRAAWWLERASALLRLDARMELVYGMALAASGSHEKAVRAYQRSLRQDADNVDALTNLGFELGVLKRFEEAEKPLRRAVELQPTNGLARANLAWVMGRGK
jgi:Flp pilus assembly protein TadD